MRLKDEIAQGATQLFLEKRGMATAFGVGLQVPNIVNRAKKRYDETMHTVNDAIGQRVDEGVAAKHASMLNAGAAAAGMGLGNAARAAGTGAQFAGKNMGAGIGKGFQGLGALPLSILTTGIGGAFSDKLKNMISPPGLGKRDDALGVMGSSAAKSFGSALGTLGVDLLKDMASKAMASAGSVGNNAARVAILQQLKREDSILAEADDRVLMEAFHTMARFAPVLSTDKNAVRSFLRQAVMSGNGPDYASIKLLADSERAVTGDKRD